MKDLLLKLNACTEAQEWAENKSWEEIYNTCHRGDWLLWLFKKTNPNDLQLLTLAKGHCANTVRHLMTAERSIAGVDTAIAFGEGKATIEELSAAYAYAAAAAIGSETDADTIVFAAYAAAAAAYAAAGAGTAAGTAAYAAYAAYAAGVDADAGAGKAENQQLTANICRKYLPIEIWDINLLNKQD
jgi:hypothetical protein